MTTTPVDPITQYYNRIGRYPANNQQWWLARSEVDDSTRGLKIGDFMPELLQKLYMGNLHAPRGHYILDAFVKDRAAISGVTGIPDQPTNDRPGTVSFFSGRSWFACGSNVYFSQILTDTYKAGMCYMESDPTSENISDPLATDGGIIPIPEAYKIIRLVPHGGAMMVFARNGVWAITGTASGFTALDISVNKVSPVGCRSPMSVIETDDAVFWWSDVGIMGVTQNKGQFTSIADFSKTNVTEQTIQAFYNAIPDSARVDVKAVFDPKANCIYWLYRDTAAANQFDKVLILDLALGAFYPWKFSSSAYKIKGLYISTRNNTYTIPTDIEPSTVEYVVTSGTSLRIAQTRSGTFTDWYSIDNIGVTYDSYMEAGYELFDDAMRKKNITYLFTYLTRTDSAVVGEETDYPSSCQMRVKWDWASSGVSNKWTTPVEIYRPGRLLFDTADTGFSMVVTKNKVRGNGKAIQFRFESSEAGKNFDLVGWSVAVSGNPIP
jgi:hypothetical protein